MGLFQERYTCRRGTSYLQLAKENKLSFDFQNKKFDPLESGCHWPKLGEKNFFREGKEQWTANSQTF